MKLTVESLAKKIEKDNEMFNKASKAERRVIVAQDCLDRIELKQIIPIEGVFCSPRKKFNRNDDNVKDILNNTNSVVCSACAKGSLFMSYIGRVNKTIFKEIDYSNSIYGDNHSKLLEIFTVYQLALIEYVYEGIQHINRDKNGKELRFDSIKIKDFRKNNRLNNPSIPKHRNILIAICNNIIENKGTFKL